MRRIDWSELDRDWNSMSIGQRSRVVLRDAVSGAITGIMVLLFLIGAIAALTTMVVVVQGYMIPGVCTP